jgi:acyl-[acyl-carrier-protein]-phospholipid O-acyltransferase/long-chain-fatty-acid--[acyl-carrier-protein] ligase
MMPAMPHYDETLTGSTLPLALLQTARRMGGKAPILEDQNREPIGYDRLILGAQVLGRVFAGQTAPGEAVGVLLPNVNAAAVTIFGLLWHGRTVAMLNFTSGIKNLRSACRTAQVKLVITSRLFVSKGGLEDIVEGLAEDVRIIYLEDVRKTIGTGAKLRGVLDKLRAASIARANCADPDARAFILFTSGSEGEPKGVVLTHRNILTNLAQIAAHIDLRQFRTFFNPLPVFHCFGLTGGLLLPLIDGIRCVLYPSPLHYREIPKLVGETGADLLFGTDTFVAGYARAADPEDLRSVKMIVCGAERVKPETRALWEPHGTMIVEGYGATECAPVLSLNTPEGNRPGTVGQMLHGIDYRLDKVKGIHEGGRLSVRGGNVMAGYLLPGGDGKLTPPEGGWHDTGDIVTVDDDRFVVIKGRAKRFAKLGGEMVSLGAIEALASQLWSDHSHVAVSIEDGKKGEKVVLVTDRETASRAELLAYAKHEGVPELWVPRAILVVDAIPVLGSGKADYASAQRLVEEREGLL